MTKIRLDISDFSKKGPLVGLAVDASTHRDPFLDPFFDDFCENKKNKSGGVSGGSNQNIAKLTSRGPANYKHFGKM